MKKRPYFSIAIPTYNRCEFLRATISILLEQTFKDFEIVITDNASSDNTAEVVKSFRDKRIRHIHNNKNIGFPNNAKKAMLAAKGKYIFTLGDDDFILFNDTLSVVKKILDKEKYGFMKINTLERNAYGSGLQKKIMNINEDIKIKRDSSYKKILDFCRRVDIGTIAGLVFKNENIVADKFFVSEVNPWFNIVVEKCRKYGGYFLEKRYVVITWPVIPKQSKSIRNVVYCVENNQLSHETFNNELFKLVPKNEERKYKREFYHKLVWFLPVAKLYTNNENLIKFAKRLKQLEPSLNHSLKMWFVFAITFLVPRSGWIIFRRFYHLAQNNINNIENLNEITERYNSLINRYYIFATN